MKKGDKVSLDGKQGTVGWTSDEMTDDERQEAHLRTADFLEQYGLSGAFQRLMAQRYRRDSDTHAKHGDKGTLGSALGE